MANSRLDPYRDEILQMVRARRTQAEIIQHLAAEYGITIRKSSLSEFIKKHTSSITSLPVNEPRVSPEEENFLSQAEVYGELQSSAKLLLDKMEEVISVLRETGSSVYTLATDTERRDNALQAGFQQVQHALANLPQRTGIPANVPNAPIVEVTRPPTVGVVSPPTVPRELIVKIWKRAFFLTGLLWLIVFFLLRLYVFGPS